VKPNIVALASFLLFCGQAAASDSITTEPEGNAYHYVSHYEMVIDAPAEDVWPVLADLGAWMDEFELSPVSGEPGAQGEVLRLYPEQAFYIQITRKIPNKFLAIANLPSTFQGERSTGVGVIALHEADGDTTVSITLSRRYTPLGDGANEMKARRSSAEFEQYDDAMWRERFLGNLKNLVEAAAE